MRERMRTTRRSFCFAEQSRKGGRGDPRVPSRRPALAGGERTDQSLSEPDIIRVLVADDHPVVLLNGAGGDDRYAARTCG